MKEFVVTVAKMARTPLGIIGLAFVLVYGIAALVATSTAFQPQERSILLYFLVGSPVLILLVFYLLVTRHPAKLYAPSDYKEDANFLTAVDDRISSSPKIAEMEEIIRQIQQEIEKQPHYKYMKLSECGKRLILNLNKKNQLRLSEYVSEQGFSKEEVDAQAEHLVQFGWATKKDNELFLSPRGSAEIKTFVDFVYARFR